MAADPHEYPVIQVKDIPLLLERFEEEFWASAIHAKIRIDTSALTPGQVLEEFLRQARARYFASEDVLRILMNE